MFVIINKRKFIISFICLLILSFVILPFNFKSDITTIFNNNECLLILEKIFELRNKALLEEDLNILNNLYDKSVKYGVWAYEHELKKMKYLHKWADKQGVDFKSIRTKIKINRIKTINDGYSINFIVSTEYKYVYKNDLDNVNFFRIGTYHILNIIKKEEGWVITKEWYTDPFADSLNLDEIEYKDIKEYILAQEKKDLSNLNERRKNAVDYADKFCGAAGNDEDGFKYNKKYRNYNYLGGDCANFASQILHEGGNFKKTYIWNYNKTGGSKAWINAQAFKDYMLNSGRASLIAYGNYGKVYKAAYNLLPGDFVAYEKKGKVTHISVVTGLDSRGYALVNCHNTDRYRVPWDLGWSNRGIKFWLIRVHF
ncbi:amidase domain-containing protein [Tepidibacter thalassicus]|uniref:Putative amidase domain-containing protein n=1 Tax=Tepidibacter thalassicus DSM 15285 TaxID=1123350 RepID=A0A1M5NQ20_9FIRM|nr:amidase domain-containing protein [Tepidibacter thalassicus]SHG91651.1 Putative amidase domain-containing protein [Tepidibacter thalassicus DSM 15285]